MCVCVCVTQLSYKRITYLKCPFSWLETGSFFETGKCLIVKVYFECLRGPSMLLLFNCCFTLKGVCLLLRRNFVKESVAAAKKFGKREQGCLKTTYL